MKYLIEYIRDELKIQPLGKLETETYESSCGDYTGEELIIDGKRVGIIIYYIDYINWLENKFLASWERKKA